MNLIKSLWAAVALAALVVAEPAAPGQFQYLPPVNGGYTYNPPKVSFPTPPPPPPYKPPPPPVTTPSYGTPPTTQPTYTPYRTPVTYPIGPATTTPRYNPPPPTDGHPGGHVHVPGMPFDFEYAVKDDAHGADYAHRASSNGDVVQGEYRNLLPDGRLQIVRYTADWATGFHADVSYQGEPRYPAPAPPGAYGPPPPQQQQPPQQTGY